MAQGAVPVLLLLALPLVVQSVSKYKDPPLPHTKCPITWHKIGCFHDSAVPPSSRPLLQQLVNDRDKYSLVNDGHLLRWGEWEDSLHSLACRCANYTSLNGYKMFGLQFYGECWSGADAEQRYNKDGISTECLMGYNQDCDKQADHVCVGKANTNYIYSLRPVCRKGGFDFEKGAQSLMNWVPSGSAFNNQPTYGDNPSARGRGQSSNHHGHYWIGGFEKRPSPESAPGAVAGDGPQGTLESPTFLITGPNISFLIGGGCDINTVRVELVVNNNVVRRTTGKCFESMERRSWELREFIGENAFIRLVDRSSAGWGHINFDDFGGDIEFCEGY